MKRAELLVNDCSRAWGGGFQIEPVILDELLDLLGACAVAEEGDRTAAVGKEINLVTNPHRVEVVRVLAGNGHHARIGEIGNPDFLRLTATVALPRCLPLEQRYIGQV